VSLAAFTWTTRVRPVVELGIGDSRSFVGAVWDLSKWDTVPAYWSGTEPSWLDISCDTRTARLEYGRQATTDRFVAGTATIVVDNVTGWADPNTDDVPGVLSVRPGRPIRVSVEHAVYGRRILFRGFVDGMVPTYTPTGADAVELSCLDALGEVNRAKMQPLSAPVGDGETASARVDRILDAIQWLPRDVRASSETLLPTDLGGQVADLLGQTADSAGGSVWGDYDGRVAFRGRDWQSYLPDTPPDATIGNVEPGHTIPGTPAVPGYLTPTVGTVTTPDPGPLPAQCVFVFKVRGPSANGVLNTLAAQWNRPNDVSWFVYRDSATGDVMLGTSTDGTEATYAPATVATQPVSTNDETLALAVRLNSGGNQIVDSFRWTGTAWVPLASASIPTRPVFDAAGPMVIGTTAPSDIWNGRIYSVELRTGLDPTAGTVVWRFDADDYPGTGTSYVDPRGRTWTLSAAGAITPKIPAEPDVVVPPDVCPVGWERPFNRADITTRAIVGRDLETAVVLDDAEGINRYGIEPFERTDLLTLRDPSLQLLAERILATRAVDTAPRVRSVALDARTSVEALDLMSSVDVYLPSRYRCRLQYPPPRGLVFDEEYFATGVAHELTPSSWTLALNLDVAAPYAIAGGRWDGAYWDLASWTDAVALLAEARTLIGALT